MLWHSHIMLAESFRQDLIILMSPSLVGAPAFLVVACFEQYSMHGDRARVKDALPQLPTQTDMHANLKLPEVRSIIFCRKHMGIDPYSVHFDGMDDE